MIEIRIHKKGFKEVEKKLQTIPKKINPALRVALRQWVIKAHRAALSLLSGSGSDAPGSYPVPVRTGNLRRLESYVLPGFTKHGETAGKFEGMLINTSNYAHAIHEGNGMHARHGARPWQVDAFEETQNDAMNDMLIAVRQQVNAL